MDPCKDNGVKYLDHLGSDYNTVVWTFRVVYKNKLLETREVSSQFEHGRNSVLLRIKYEDKSEEELEELAALAKLASPWCTICGGDTLDGCFSCVGELFCSRCEDKIPEYKEKYTTELILKEMKREEEQEKERLRRKSEARKILDSYYLGL